jgi:hypothetical protein
VITRAVGTDPDVDVESFTVEARVGDVFLICSDGLTDMVADEEILGVLDRHHDDLDRATKALVSAANRGGGVDNITVVAFAIGADGDTATMRVAADDDTLHGERGGPGETVDTMVVRPDEVEAVLLEPGSPEALAAVEGEPISPAARVRLVLAMLALLGVAAVLLIWGLLR